MRLRDGIRLGINMSVTTMICSRAEALITEAAFPDRTAWVTMA
jgi:hypothetical protein